MTANPPMLGHWTISSGLALPVPLHRLPSIGTRRAPFIVADEIDDFRDEESAIRFAVGDALKNGTLVGLDSARSYFDAARRLYSTSSWDTVAYQSAYMDAFRRIYIGEASTKVLTPK